MTPTRSDEISEWKRVWQLHGVFVVSKREAQIKIYRLEAENEKLGKNFDHAIVQRDDSEARIADLEAQLKSKLSALELARGVRAEMYKELKAKDEQISEILKLAYSYLPLDIRFKINTILVKGEDAPKPKNYCHRCDRDDCGETDALYPDCFKPKSSGDKCPTCGDKLEPADCRSCGGHGIIESGKPCPVCKKPKPKKKVKK